MKVTCISDTHEALSEMQIEETDLLIHAGDWTFEGTKTSITNFAIDMSRIKAKKRIAIAGNHDFGAEKNPSEVRQILKDYGIEYLQDELTIWEGLRIYGSPFTPKFFDWAFMRQRGWPMKIIWDKIPENIDILITHGPPFGVLDHTSGKHGPVENVGCEDLLERIKIIKPKLHVFGHIHPSYGVARKEWGLCVNAANMNDRYEPVNKPIVLDWEDGWKV